MRLVAFPARWFGRGGARGASGRSPIGEISSGGRRAVGAGGAPLANLTVSTNRFPAVPTNKNWTVPTNRNGVVPTNVPTNRNRRILQLAQNLHESCLFYGPDRCLPPDSRFFQFLLVGTTVFNAVGITVFLLVGTTFFLLVGTTVFLLVGTTVFLLVGTTLSLLVGTTAFLLVGAPFFC